jgi:hypothetical protein
MVTANLELFPQSRQRKMAGLALFLGILDKMLKNILIYPGKSLPMSGICAI